MTPETQRHIIVNFIKNKGDQTLPDHMSSDCVERLIFERGLIRDPLTLRDGIHAAIHFLGHAQRIRFYIELSCLFEDSGDNTENLVNIVCAEPPQLCEAFLKAIGRWYPTL